MSVPSLSQCTAGGPAPRRPPQYFSDPCDVWPRYPWACDTSPHLSTFPSAPRHPPGAPEPPRTTTASAGRGAADRREERGPATPPPASPAASGRRGTDRMCHLSGWGAGGAEGDRQAFRRRRLHFSCSAHTPSLPSARFLQSGVQPGAGGLAPPCCASSGPQVPVLPGARKRVCPATRPLFQVSPAPEHPPCRSLGTPGPPPGL